MQISGIFLASYDSRHRKFTFVLFYEYKKHLLELIRAEYQEAIRRVNFDVSVFVDMGNDELLDSYENFLQRTDILLNEGIWQSAYYNSSRLISTQFNSTLYRKLIMNS